MDPRALEWVVNKAAAAVVLEFTIRLEDGKRASRVR
jgi:hypothetical protein